MNYLKHFLEKDQQNQQQQTVQKYSPQLSGDFEIMQWPDEPEQKNETNDKQTNVQSNNDCNNNDYIVQNQKTQTSKESCDCFEQKSGQSSQHQYRIIELDEVLQQQVNKNSLKKNIGSASTIKIDQYYMIVDKQQIKEHLQTQQQWFAFYKKIKSYQTTKPTLSCSSSKIKIQKNQLKLSLKQLNSILQIPLSDIQKRKQYWDRIAVSQSTHMVVFKNTQLCNKKDPQKLDKNVNKLINNLAVEIVNEMENKQYRKIQNKQKQLDKWKEMILRMLTLYGANDKQIGYSKGIQYIVLGIIISKPFPSLSILSSQQLPTIQYQLQCHFKYLMFTKQLRNMYFPGTPKLYQQIQQLQQLIKVQVSQLYSKLSQINADYMKIFINYYKTFMLYKLKNPFLIRKMLELLIIYGIDIVRILITRIMNLNQHKILEIKDQAVLLKYLAESLFLDYFQDGDDELILEKFRHLFILDTEI